MKHLAYITKQVLSLMKHYSPSETKNFLGEYFK